MIIQKQRFDIKTCGQLATPVYNIIATLLKTVTLCICMYVFMYVFIYHIQVIHILGGAVTTQYAMTA